MARLLPLQGETEVPDSGPRVVDLEGEDADAVFSALSSDTARDIYRALQEEPHAPSEVAEAADTSIQNVRYHLDNLEEAGLVEVVDTWYSSRGNEMSVYAPTSDALVLASGEEETSRLKTALSRLVSGIVVLALASLAFHRAAKSLVGGKIGFGSGPAATGESESGDYGIAADGGDGGGVPGDDAAAQDQSATTTVVEDGATESGDVSIMDADTTTNVQADTTAPAEEATRTATDAAQQTETPLETEAPQGTETPMPEPTAEPETARTVTEYVNTSLEQAARDATTTAPPDPSATIQTTDATRLGNEAVQSGGLPPGVVFFIGGAIVLVSVVAYLHWRGV